MGVTAEQVFYLVMFTYFIAGLGIVLLAREIGKLHERIKKLEDKPDAK